MATTVNGAFDDFLRYTVRLDPDRTDIAKKSKTTLVNEILNFPSDGIFLPMHSDKSIDYGSFSRKTKIRPLDDIDLMIILNAQGNWRIDYTDHFKIYVPDTAEKQLRLCNEGTNVLNSIKVINRFKEYLSKVSFYDKAEIKRNQEAVTLNLKSYEWVFDIVPCFVTIPEDFTGRTFYLIPDGRGNWKATDPRIDKQRTNTINAKQKVSVIDMIRLIKYWASRRIVPNIQSYFLENLILNYYDSASSSYTYVDVELPALFSHIYHNIHLALNDPKGFQGDINHLNYEDRNKIQTRASQDYQKAVEARRLETNGNMKESIQKWGEIFGDRFPSYF